MTGAERWLVFAVAVAGIAGCGGDANTEGNDATSILRFMTPTRAPEAAEDPGSVFLSGKLVPEAAQIVIDSVGSAPLILMVIASSDCFTCENLGQQLREVVRLASSDFRVVVATNADGLRRTREFLRRERVSPTLVFGVESFSILEGAAEVPTPAVLLGRSAADSLGGVAHATRAANARSVSFAEELGLAPP